MVSSVKSSSPASEAEALLQGCLAPVPAAHGGKVLGAAVVERQLTDVGHLEGPAVGLPEEAAHVLVGDAGREVDLVVRPQAVPP